MQQQLDFKMVMYMLERIIRYHIMMMFNVKEYDPNFNETLLKTYFADLMEIYENCINDTGLCDIPNYYEFRCYYLLLNIDDISVVCREFTLDEVIQRECDGVPCESYQSSLHVSKLYHVNDYYQFFESVKNKLTLLQSCILLKHFNSIRVSFLRVINKAFGLKFPLTRLSDWLKFDKQTDLKVMLTLLNIRFDEQFVYFSKQKLADVDLTQLHNSCRQFVYYDLMQSKVANMSPCDIVSGQVVFKT